MPAVRESRCAIYTRVSTDAGLEQDFNSLDAQREAAEAYIKSQAHEGWRLVPGSYDDGGYSGGTLERPALARLLEDVRAKIVDVIVVYKVDRLTRSLADFAKLVELFDQNGTSFVSVTQAFNTTTSMGRLTLNVLLSFAQFEREVTAERIRDKIAASKKKGIWVGGVPPFGYRVEDRKLVIDPLEAEIVLRMFRRYLELGSLLPLLEELHRTGVRSRPRMLSNGKKVGGISFTRGPLNYLLKNRTYIGFLNHHGSSYQAEHEPIVDVGLFEAVQTRLAENIQPTRLARSDNASLLQGRLFDDRGNLMTPTYTRRNGVRYRYYACRLLYEGRSAEAGHVRRISASQIEGQVLAAARQQSADTLETVGSDHELIQKTFCSVVVHADHLVLTLASASGHGGKRLTLPWNPQPRRPKREILLPHVDSAKDDRPIRSETRMAVVKAVALGRLWLQQLIRQPDLSLEDIARREGRSRRSIQMHISLSFVAPEIINALLAGKLPRGIGITRLINLPNSWEQQFEVLGLQRTGIPLGH
jgi:DNA invertase Pin-like site-specific DNA recombinase